MRLTKEQLYEAALALNGDDKKYSISIENDKIITRVKWMDARFFSPTSITDEMKEFAYIVSVDDRGRYTELDKSVSTTTSVNGAGFQHNKKMQFGKQISFNKTIGVGKDNLNDHAGIVNVTFNSEEYKLPVRTLLKNSGYKKKKGALGKILVCVAVFVIIVAVVIAMVISRIASKTAISVDDFSSAAKAHGYLIAIDEDFKKDPDVKDVRIAIDKEKNYQIDLCEYIDTDVAKRDFGSIRYNFQKSNSEDGTYSSVTSWKYDRWEDSTSDLYQYVARIDNTIIYAEVDSKYKDKVKQFIDDIGY